jgi:predicted ATPase/class 3 adenylate cyclase
MRDLPAGTVTFLLADIEASTRLLQRLGARHAEVLAQYRRIIREALETHHGREVDAQGDAFFAVFSRASDALRGAVAVQQALSTSAWPDGSTVRARMGIHTGEAARAEGGYVGMDVHRAARVCDAAHGGQVLVSEATREVVEDDLPSGIALRALGEYRLKDLPRPERLYQVLHADLPAEFPPLRSLGALPNNLPRQLTTFVGREREMAEGRRLLAKSYLLTLTGPGGCGKTRLALQLAGEIVAEFRDGVWFAEMAPVADPSRVAHVVASVLSVREQPGRPVEATLVDYLQSRELLLILDGCEHLVEACATLADVLLRGSPGLRIIVTSREPLHIPGETTLRVPSLSTPDPRRRATPETVVRFDAVQLFADRAAAASPGFTVTEHNAQWVAQICHRLDGIPLAIELAAARMSVLPVEQIAERLHDRFRLLTGGSRTARRRQQTLRAAIDWSYDLLSDPERVLFRRLGVFAGGFSLEAAEVVCAGDECDAGLVLDLLTRLVDRSLVMSTAQQETVGEARFWMLETVREYAAEVLRQSAEEAAVRRRHLGYFLDLAGRAEAELRGPRQVIWLATLEREHENIRFWFMRGYLTDGREALERALAQRDRGSPSERAWALSALALLAWRQRDYDATVLLGTQSVGLCREAHDDRACAYAENALALAARDQGDLVQAEARHEETLELFRRIGDRWGVALALQNLAYVAHRRGDYERAGRFGEDALTIFREVGDRWGIGTSLYILGRMALRQTHADRARRLFTEALALFRELGDAPLVGFALIGLGSAAGQQGHGDQARAFFEESLALMRDMGDKRGIADATAHLGVLASRRGDEATAARMYQESLRLDAELGNRQGIAEGLERLAGLAASRDPEQAARLVAAAGALRAATGMPISDVDRPHVEQTIAAARNRLGDGAFARASDEGGRFSVAAAVDAALRVET